MPRRPPLAVLPLQNIAAVSTNVCGHKSTLSVDKVARDPGSVFCQCKIYLCLPHKHKNRLKAVICVLCGPYRDRTGHLLIANEALYQMS